MNIGMKSEYVLSPNERTRIELELLCELYSSNGVKIHIADILQMFRSGLMFLSLHDPDIMLHRSHSLNKPHGNTF